MKINWGALGKALCLIASACLFVLVLFILIVKLGPSVFLALIASALFFGAYRLFDEEERLDKKSKLDVSKPPTQAKKNYEIFERQGTSKPWKGV